MDQSKSSGESYYGRHYSADDLQRLAQLNQQAMMNDSMVQNLMASGMDNDGIVGGRTLDELVNQNNEQRRRSYHQQLGGMDFSPDVDAPRSSMMDFGTHRDDGLGNYQFGPSPIVTSPGSVPNNGGVPKARMDDHMADRRRESRRELGLDTQFNDMNPSFEAMVQSPAFQQAISPDQMDMNSANYMPDMNMGLDYSNMSQDMGPMGMFPQSGFQVPLSSQLQQQAVRPMMDSSQQHGGDGNNGEERTLMEKTPQMNMSDAMMENNFVPPMANPTATAASEPMPSSMAQGQTVQGLENSQPLSQDTVQPAVQSESQQPDQTSNGGCTMRTFTTSGEKADPKRRGVPQYPNAYSQTGFDMLGVLMRIATRPKPQINIGAVDMSCAFVVCDATNHDVPIVYCSEVFERLTGYTRHEILGRNCRFLQAPDGKVQAGVERKYVDDQAVYHLKNAIYKHQEAQISIINYRKGGQPFMNLLTMIPIAWDTDELRYYVGFQVDVVEQPTSITNKNPDGSYSINYQQSLLPRYVLNKTPETNRGKELEIGQPMERDDVSMVLSTLSTGDSELSKRVWDKVLLENSDDVLHVLSLKGLFLYLSQASRKILEYEPHELVGAALSSVCHPSDIVPVTRELKDTTPGATVNVVYRIRRKHSGYTWFESHGALHTEQGKGKKCIILVGRERPVYALQRSELVNPNEIGESELWSKMSTSGMFLFVSTNARSLLDRQPDELRGTSAQALMRSESKAEFDRVLEIARAGIKTTLKHDIQNKRGQTLHAQTTLYPGDACEGQKPTFLVAQTKLLKMSRSAPALNKQNSINSDKSNPASVGNGFAANLGAGQLGMPRSGNIPLADALVTSAGGGALAIGNQHQALASEDNVFDELKTTRSTSWQFELRQMEKRNRVLAEEMQSLNSSKKKRKRRQGMGQLQKDCANCHTRSTPEWRRGPSGQRDLCNSCGLRWAKQNGRVSPRTSSQHSDKNSDSPASASPAKPADKSGTVVSPKETKVPQQQQNGDPYNNAPQARAEQQSCMPGYGGSFPAKIEEVAEPMEDEG